VWLNWEWQVASIGETKIELEILVQSLNENENCKTQAPIMDNKEVKLKLWAVFISLWIGNSVSHVTMTSNFGLHERLTFL
jgi:hypothetical protein